MSKWNLIVDTGHKVHLTALNLRTKKKTALNSLLAAANPLKKTIGTVLPEIYYSSNLFQSKSSRKAENCKVSCTWMSITTNTLSTFFNKWKFAIVQLFCMTYQPSVGSPLSNKSENCNASFTWNFITNKPMEGWKLKFILNKLKFALVQLICMTRKWKVTPVTNLIFW